jgi:hypothetical protein
MGASSPTPAACECLLEPRTSIRRGERCYSLLGQRATGCLESTRCGGHLGCPAAGQDVLAEHDVIAASCGADDPEDPGTYLCHMLRSLPASWPVAIPDIARAWPMGERTASRIRLLRQPRRALARASANDPFRDAGATRQRSCP